MENREYKNMSESDMMSKIAGCSSQHMPRLVDEWCSELNANCIQRILDKTIAMDLIFVVRCLDKHALLRKEHMEIICKKAPKGYRAELQRISERLH